MLFASHLKGIKIYTILAVLIVLFFVGVWVVLRNGRVTQNNTSVIPTTSVQNVESAMRILSSNPVPNATDVPVHTSSLRVTLSRELTSGSLTVTVSEKSTQGTVPTAVSVNGKIVSVELQRVLAPNEEYLVSVIHEPQGESVGNFRFTTKDEAPVDTYPFGLFEQQEQANLETRPDIYVANKLPYETTDMNISYQFKNGALAFSATSETFTDAQLRAAVQEWLLSIGLSRGQISGLQIGYSPR